MSRKDLLKKIQRCMALSKSANEHEATTALAIAQRLIAQYGVDQDELDTLDVEEATARRHPSQTAPRWETLLASAVVRAIRCSQILDGRERRFVGIGPAPEIAAYAFTVLLRQIKRARGRYIAEQLPRVRTAARKRARADAYCEGWATSVFTAIAALYPRLEPEERVTNHLAKRFGDQLTTIESRAAKGARTDNDWLHGRIAGSKVELHHGVDRSAAAPVLLT